MIQLDVRHAILVSKTIDPSNVSLTAPSWQTVRTVVTTRLVPLVTLASSRRMVFVLSVLRTVSPALALTLVLNVLISSMKSMEFVSLIVTLFSPIVRVVPLLRSALNVQLNISSMEASVALVL